MSLDISLVCALERAVLAFVSVAVGTGMQS